VSSEQGVVSSEQGVVSSEQASGGPSLGGIVRPWPQTGREEMEI